MDPIYHNFITWWSPYMLKIWLPENCSGTWGTVKKRRAICYINGDSGQWLLSGMFLNLVFTYYTAEQLTKVPDTAMSMLHSSPSPHCLQRQLSPIGLSYHCWISFQAVSTFTNLVLCHLWLCSNVLKRILHFFFSQSGHLNWYLQHHSLAYTEPLLCGEI